MYFLLCGIAFRVYVDVLGYWRKLLHLHPQIFTLTLAKYGRQNACHCHFHFIHLWSLYRLRHMWRMYVMSVFRFWCNWYKNTCDYSFDTTQSCCQDGHQNGCRIYTDHYQDFEAFKSMHDKEFSLWKCNTLNIPHGPNTMLNRLFECLYSNTRPHNANSVEDWCNGG